jgi:hypothetical protein
LLKEIKAYETWEKMKKETEVWNVVFKMSFVAAMNDQFVIALGACNNAFSNSDYIVRW